MKAIVYTGPGQVRVVEDWPEPVCAPDEVVVQMRAVGLCGSDLSVYDGHRDLPSLPWLMGHEGGGELVEVGEQVSDRRVGERVVIEPNLSCLSCPACLSGVTSDCPKRRILGMNAPGVLAERVAVPAAFVLPVPAAWPDQVLACFELQRCPSPRPRPAAAPPQWSPRCSRSPCTDPAPVRAHPSAHGGGRPRPATRSRGGG